MKNHKQKTILLVEDEIIIAMGESVIIEKYGFAVVTAASGKQAIEMARTNPDIDLILMDIDLGRGLDGTQAAAQILQFRELPIVFLTGHSEKEMVDKVKKITRYGYVLKNSGEFVLIESINMAFELFEAHQRAEAENQKLQATERKFRTMYQFSRAGIARLGLDSKIEQANPTYCRMLGYTEPELIGKTISDITHPDDLPENLEKQTRLGRGEIENYTMEKRFLHKDGHPVYGLLNASLVRDNEGNPEYFLGNVVDITDSKQADKLLKTRKKLNEAILNSVTAHIAVLNKNGVIIAVNEAWHKFAADNGMSPEVGLGENYFDICQATSETTGIIKGMKAVLTGERSRFSVEYPCHSPTEERWFWMHVVPLKNDEGGLVVSHINITDHKKTTRELHQYKHIVRTSPDALSLVDRDYCYRVVSDEYLRRTNRQRHEIEGRPVAEVMGQAVFDNIVKPELDRCFNGEIVRYQEWFDFPCAGPRFVDVIYTPYRGDGQTISGALVSAKDVTEMAEFQKEADRQRRALRALVDAAHDSILLIKPDGEIIECNQTVADRFGRERQSLIGTNTFDLVPAEVADFRRYWADRVLETGQPVQFDNVRHGRDIRNSINPVLNNRGEVEALAVFGADITEQKQAAVAIQESEARQSAILQAIPDLMFVLAVDGQILDYKASHTEDLVLEPEAVINSYIQTSFPPDTANLVLQAIKTTIKTGKLQTFEYQLTASPAGHPGF